MSTMGTPGIDPALTSLTTPMPTPRPESVFYDDVELRPSEYEALVGGRRAGLTRREFQILACLARRPDRVITRQEVYEEVWGGAMPHRDRSVDVFVRKVRRKLAGVAPGRQFVHTHFGVGYRFAPDPPAE